MQHIEDGSSSRLSLTFDTDRVHPASIPAIVQIVDALTKIKLQRLVIPFLWLLVYQRNTTSSKMTFTTQSMVILNRGVHPIAVEKDMVNDT